MRLISAKTILSLSALLFFSCNDEGFLDRTEEGTPCDYISFGISPDENARTRGNAGTERNGYTSDRFVLRSADTADTLCVRAIVSDGIDGSAFEGETPVTRSVPVTSLSTYGSFHVLAYWKKDGTSAGGFYMDEDVTEQGSNIWSSERTYYWPGSGHTFQFYAWAPVDATDLSTPQSPTVTTLGYIVPEDVSNQKDILVATTAETAGDYNATLPLSFRHICTAVKFTTGSQMQPGTIKSVALKGVRNSGTYDMANDSWALDAVTADFSQALGRSMDGSETAGSEVTTEKGTFMMLPQTLPDGAMIEVVFTDAVTGSERTFTASVAGTEWPQGKTVIYRLSISPEYEFRLEDEDKILDAHFEIFKTNLIVEGVPEGMSWTITAPTVGDGTLGLVTIQAQADMNSYSAGQGFWTDRWLQTSGTDLLDNGSARGEQTYSGTGNGTFPIAIFVPENVGDATRDIKLSIQLNGNDAQTINIPQLSPSWFSDGLGCERIEGTPAPWGFYWTEDYALTYDLTGSDQASREDIYDYVSFYKTLNNTVIIKWILTYIFGVNIPDLSFVEMTQTNIGGNIPIFNPPNYIANTVTINLGQLQPDDIALSETDGQSNTRDVYNYEGIQYANTIISRLEALGVQPTTTGEGINPTYNASIACMRYLNSWNIIPQDDGYLLTLSADDHNPSWYLPARGEVSGIADTDYPLSGEYWSSTSVESSNTQAYKYSSDGATIKEELRNAVLNVRAVRKKP